MARWTVFFSRTRSLVWRDLRKRKTMARGRRVVLVAHVHQISLIFEKKTSYAIFDIHSSNSYTGQDANFRKTETMRQSYPILDCTSSYTMCNFREEEEITHNFFGCFFVARNPAVLILFEKQIIFLILSSFWSRTYRGVKLFLFEKEREIEIMPLHSDFWTPT
jgi:hypothetical protein